MTVLIGYASAFGSTRGIAEHIAARLRDRGVAAESRPLDEVRDVHGYDAFVLGSAVHGMAWLPEATAFVRVHFAALAAHPVWLFSVGSKDSLRGPIGHWMAARYPIPKGIAEHQDAIGPRGHRILTGVIRRDQYPPISRVVVRLMGGRYGDFRDWPAIDAWTDEIAGSLASRPEHIRPSDR